MDSFWEEFDKLKQPFPNPDNNYIHTFPSTTVHYDNYSERSYEKNNQPVLIERESDIYDNEYGCNVSMLELNYYDRKGLIEYTVIAYSLGGLELFSEEFNKKYPPTQILYRNGILVQKFVCEPDIDTYTFYKDKGLTMSAIAKIHKLSDGSIIDFTNL